MSATFGPMILTTNSRSYMDFAADLSLLRFTGGKLVSDSARLLLNGPGFDSSLVSLRSKKELDGGGIALGLLPLAIPLYVSLAECHKNGVSGPF